MIGNTKDGRQATRHKQLEFARCTGAIAPAEVRKLQGVVREAKVFLKDGFHPVVFCRFVDTADYAARHLRGALPDQVRVESVTGRLPPAERESELTIRLMQSELYAFPAERTAIQSMPGIKRRSYPHTRRHQAAPRGYSKSSVPRDRRAVGN